ncbi:phage tail tape measure protein [Sporomusa acidovorans]|uniref:Phage tail tape measure protein domain-containing protein n=1 Tax=Sporomusa acidovorans (strain ATCC 49682 / DSM 3132 / Mol) TaxID=1123286 RepID=A0ABZ3J899_SPOA4|nr:phage tail tape measure protein [Sporomusa acidovorans]OZC16009.1 phage-related minor tail protein [Sporomusa acidovorans DSM 3132]SDD89849.1 phage tail tape measure protein, TP901 family, core region [Sporomusa acidovorans]
MSGRMYEIAFNIMARMGPGFNQAFSSASGRMTQLNTQVSGLKKEMKELDTQQRKGVISVFEYSAAYEKLTAQLYKAEQRQKSYAKVYALQNKVNQSRSNARMNMVGAVETAATVGTPIYSAMNFETAMSGVAKQVDGARDDAGQLTEVYYQAQSEVMQASKDMMILPDNMAKAFAMAAKSGVQGMENIDKFARMGIMMGTAFEAPAEQITEDFAKIGSAMGIHLDTVEGINQLEALADTVNYLDDRSNASGADIIDVLKRTSGAATSLLPTLSRTTLAGMSTALLQMGETGETAGTALNALFTKIAAAPTQSKSFQGALAQLGLTAEELQSGALSDAEGTITNLFERIGQLDAASKNNVLAELFGAEHIDNLSKISGNYEEFLRVIKMGNSAEAKGSMMKEFEIQSQNTERQLEGLQASAARTAIVLSGRLLPTVKTLAQWVSTGADWIGNFSKEHDTLSNVLVGTTAAVLAGTVAFSAMAWAGWAVISPFVSLYGWTKKIELATKLSTGAQWAWNASMTAGRTVMGVGQLILRAAWTGIVAAATWAWTGAQWAWNAAMTANPIGLLIVGIGGLVAAGYYLIQNWDTVKVWWTQLWDDPAAALQAFVDGIYSRFSPAFDWLSEKAAWVKNLFSGDSNVAAADLSMNIPAYANGTIATTPHVGLFAEKGPEAIIPLDGSSNALSLWATAGQMLGIGGGQSLFQDFVDSPSGSGGGGNTFVFSPNVMLTGGDPEVEGKVRSVIREEADDFENRMNAWAAQQRRLAYD